MIFPISFPLKRKKREPEALWKKWSVWYTTKERKKKKTDAGFSALKPASDVYHHDDNYERSYQGNESENILLPRIVGYFGGVVAVLRLRVSVHVVHLHKNF